jgi:SAM-dependent methyltransferase
MNLKDFTESNRVAWNQAAEYHRKYWGDKLRTGFAEPGFSTLNPTVTEVLRSFPLESWHVAQPCCNNGRELLSILNLGGASGVGFDISDEFIADACELARISKHNCQFLCTDIYDIPWDFEAKFDLVYVSIGALTWLPDLERFLTMTSFLLKPGGYLVMHEQHPMTYVLGMPGDAGFREDAPYEPLYDYFRTGALQFSEGLDYYRGEQYESAPKFEFAVRMSDLLNGMIRNGIDLQELHEYRKDISNCFGYLGDHPMLPLSFLLIGRKRGAAI